MTTTPIFVIDAFVGTLGAGTPDERVLRGNPAAVAWVETVCQESNAAHGDAPRDTGWMQAVANEMNLSETAFLTPIDAVNFRLRWFTPQCEVDLCGHATLASAHFLWESGRAASGSALFFHTNGGVLGARSEGEWIWLDFPAQLPLSVNAPPDLSLALGFAPDEPVAFWRAGDDFLALVPVATIATMQPDFAWLRQICGQLRIRGVIVTASGRAGSAYDFVSRFFAPAIGLDEDPVTGSAHAALSPFWGARLGKNELTGLQASVRGGIVRVAWQGERVHLAGHAQTTMRGVLSL